MKTYFDFYGEYIPGFFKISISKNLFENMNWGDFNNEELATLIHEYVHFLQDISTMRGVSNFLYVSKILQMNFAKAAQCTNTINLPFDFEKINERNAYVAGELQTFYSGSSKHMEVKKIVQIAREEEEIINEMLENKEHMYSINVYYDDAKYPYMFGVGSIAESMAYIVETELFRVEKRTHEFPYNLCEMICEKECPRLLQNKAILVAICELSLMHYHSGDMFWQILNEINNKNLLFNTVDEFEEYFNSRTDFLFQELSTHLTEIEEVIDILYPINIQYLSTANLKVKSFFKNGINYRLKNKFFIARLLESASPIIEINKFMHYFGVPILCDNDNNVFSTDDSSVVLAPLALYNFFMNRKDNSCALEPICCNQKAANYDKNICINKPWEQANKDSLCQFGLYWYHRALNGKSVKRMTL